MEKGHKHEWQNNGEMDFEDYAAIIQEVCLHEEIISSSYSSRWDEEFHETGPQCGEERTIRFDASEIEFPDGQTFEISSDHSKISEETETFLMQIQDAAQNGHVEVVDVDPDPQNGMVIIEKRGYRLTYRA